VHLLQGRAGDRGVELSALEIPEEWDDFAAPEPAGFEVVVQLLLDQLPHILLLPCADLAGGAFLADGLFFDDLVGLSEHAGDAVGVEPQGEVQGVVKNVVFEGKPGIKDVPAAPAVFDLVGDAVLGFLQDVLLELL
jgi:hypothetical protein